MAGPYKSEASNFTVTLGGVNITGYCTQSSIEATVAEIDATNLASTGAESAPASTSWATPVSGLLDKAIDDVFGPTALTPPATMKNLVVTVGPVGSVTTFTWTGTTSEGATIESYTVAPTEPTQLITWSGALLISGGPTIT